MNYYLSLILRLVTPFLISYNLLNKLLFPLTLYLTYFFYKLFNPQLFLYDSYLITFNNYIRFTPACAAISAYFLLLLLIVFSKDIKLLIRLKLFLIGSFLILLFNLLRLLLLIFILEKFGFNLFEKVHLIFWYLFGSLFVALLWILLIKHYKIKSTPIYSDLKYLLK